MKDNDNNNRRINEKMGDKIFNELCEIIQRYQNIHTPQNEILYSVGQLYTAAILTASEIIRDDNRKRIFIHEMVDALHMHVIEMQRQWIEKKQKLEEGR